MAGLVASGFLPKLIVDNSSLMQLVPMPLTRMNFKEFGEVIELENARQQVINNGRTIRFHDLLTVDVNDQGGWPLVNVFRTSPLDFPHKVSVMERHPLGSQGFIPMDTRPFLVLVGRGVEKLSVDDLSLFVTNGRQGINLKKNTWHHFQMVLNGPQDFIVIDRGGGDNLEETTVTGDVWIARVCD